MFDFGVLPLNLAPYKLNPSTGEAEGFFGW
jgi:hypothetical protein